METGCRFTALYIYIEGVVMTYMAYIQAKLGRMKTLGDNYGLIVRHAWKIWE